MDENTTPAGWYPSPNEPGAERFFDGQTWSEHRRPSQTPPPANPAPGDLPKPWWRRWWALTLWGLIGLTVIAGIAGSPTEDAEIVAAEPAEPTATTAESSAAVETGEPTTTVELTTTTADQSAVEDESTSTTTAVPAIEADPVELKNAAYRCASSLYTYDRAVADELLTPELDTATGSWLDQRLYELSTSVDAACGGIGAAEDEEGWNDVARRYDFERGDGTFSNSLSEIYSRQRETHRAIKDWYNSGTDRDLALILGNELDSPESTLWPDFDAFNEWFETGFATIEGASPTG